MKFSEKLIELRKKEGLSQEELGYKLNVTRQTVSKWELGQTTPEMDKLVEMSKIFNISVDNLINESEISTNANPVIEDQPIENKTREKNIKIIIIAVLILVTVLIGVKLFAAVSSMNNAKDISKDTIQKSENIFEKIFSIFDKQTDNIEKIQDNAQNIIEDTKDKMDNTQNIIEDTKNKMDDTSKEIDIDKFNNSIEIYNGTNIGQGTKLLLDRIITSNKTEERKITVKFLETETQEETKIKEMKRSIETFDNYEVTFEYDEDGFINKAIIEKL